MKDIDLYLSDGFLSHQIYVLRLTAEEKKKVLSLLTDMEKELKAKLSGDLTDWGKARVSKLLKECNEAIKKYYGEIADSTDLPAIAKHEAQFTQQTFATIGLEASLPTEAALKSIVSDMLIEGAPSAEWWQKQAADTQFRFANQVRQGIAQGETLQEIIRRVAGSKRLGTVGIMEVSRKNASALVHTSIQTISNDARLATFRANADIIKGVKWLATFDGHTCLKCWPLSGKEWDLSGKPLNGNFPFRNAPIHWNCRCVLTPITKTYSELGVSGISEPPRGTRSSDLGQINSDTTAEEFIKRHDRKWQAEVFGEKRAEMFINGKLTLNQLLDFTGNPLTLSQLNAKYNP